MKLTNTQTMKRKAGMTLLELTVVILVLLSLISILFVGARAWKKGSDRAACILNIRNVQQAVRGHQNMTNKNAGDTFTRAEIIDANNGYLNTDPECPANGTYTLVETYPAISSLAMTCSLADTQQHVPNDTTGW